MSIGGPRRSILPEDRLEDDFYRQFVQQNVYAGAREQRQRTPQVGDHVVTRTGRVFRRPTVFRVEPTRVFDDSRQTHVHVHRSQLAEEFPKYEIARPKPHGGRRMFHHSQ